MCFFSTTRRRRRARRAVAKPKKTACVCNVVQYLLFSCLPYIKGVVPTTEERGKRAGRDPLGRAETRGEAPASRAPALRFSKPAAAACGVASLSLGIPPAVVPSALRVVPPTAGLLGNLMGFVYKHVMTKTYNGKMLLS